MNVLIISPGLYPDIIGGMEILNYHLIKYLNKNHNISVLTNCSKNIDNVNTYRIKRIISTKLSYLFRLMYVLYKEKDRTDIIYISYTNNANWLHWILFPILKRIFLMKYLVLICSGRATKWKFPLLFGYFFKNVSYILCFSKVVKDNYTKILKKNVFQIKGSADSFITIDHREKEVVRKQYGVSIDSKIILFFSRFDPIKSPITIINSIDELGENFLIKNKLEFWFCGAGTKLNTLKQDIKSKKHIENYVKIWGLVTEKDKSAIYKMSDIFIQPSLSEATIPATLQEAMKNGIPSISSNIKQISEQLTDKENIILFQKKDHKDLSNKLKYLIRNPEKAKKIGKSGKKFFDNLATKTNVFADIEKYLEKAAKES